MRHLNFIILLLSLCPILKAQTPVPPTLEDLPRLTPTQAGIHPDSIQHLIQLINDNPPADFRGMVVLKDNQLVVEEYFNTYWRSTIHDIRSAAKSITAVLLGIAIDQGLVESIEQPVYEFFPSKKFNYQERESLKNIQIKHLLMMSSGMDADTFDPNSAGNAINWVAKKDWISYILNLPVVFASGEKWVYNDAAALLIGAIIEERSGMKLVDYAQKHLFDPLGIQEYYWFSGGQNHTGAMGNLYISTLDFAKIGLVLLNQGSYQGKQIVSSEWVDALKAKQLSIKEQNPFAKDYGFFWYINEMNIGEQSYEYFFAAGNGGNNLYIVPEANLVISLTSSAYGLPHGSYRSQNIFRYLLASIEK